MSYLPCQFKPLVSIVITVIHISLENSKRQALIIDNEENLY